MKKSICLLNVAIFLHFCVSLLNVIFAGYFHLFTNDFESMVFCMFLSTLSILILIFLLLFKLNKSSGERRIFASTKY